MGVGGGGGRGALFIPRFIHLLARGALSGPFLEKGMYLLYPEIKDPLGAFGGQASPAGEDERRRKWRRRAI